MRLILLCIVGCALLGPLPASAELKGVRQYERGQYARARKTLEKELRSKKLSKEERSRARLYLAATLYASGAQESARIQLEELALTDPTVTVDPVIFPEGFVALAEESFQRMADKRAAASSGGEAATAPPAPSGGEAGTAPQVTSERPQPEAQVAKPPSPAPEAPAPAVPPEQTPRLEDERAPSTVQLSPTLFGFMDPLGRAVGAGGGLTLGLGSLELGARVLMGQQLGVGLEAGLVLGSGALRPRIGLRGTAIPGVKAFGGGAVVGLRIRPASRLSFLVDVGAEYFSAPAQYRALALTGSAGVGFDLL
jgi:hypothetical protein